MRRLILNAVLAAVAFGGLGLISQDVNFAAAPAGTANNGSTAAVAVVAQR